VSAALTAIGEIPYWRGALGALALESLYNSG
jgi:hypothetical protein